MLRKVISAVGDSFIVNNLENNSFEVTGDVFEQEVLFDLLKNECFDFLIISTQIEGTHSKYSLIKQLRDINSKIKIIVITTQEDNQFFEYLISKNINHYFIDGKFTFEDILKILNKVESNEIIKLNQEIEKNITETSLISTFDTQEIIAFAGTAGSGKSTVLVNLALLLAEKSLANVLIIDLDTLNASINNFFDISISPNTFNYELPIDKNSSLNYLVDFIDKKTFDENILEKAAIKLKKYDNLSVITGNSSLSVCKNILSYEHYSKILDKAKQLYDFIFIDTSSNIFLDSTQFALTNATKILFITEPNDISINRSQKLFSEVYKAWGIDENKLELIFNKVNKHAIEKTIVREIFNKYKVASFIDYDEKYIKHLNMKRPYVIDNESFEYEELLEEFSFIKKKTLKERLRSGKLFNFTI